jgi:hypothetical protein
MLVDGVPPCKAANKVALRTYKGDLGGVPYNFILALMKYYSLTANSVLLSTPLRYNGDCQFELIKRELAKIANLLRRLHYL